jgi:hypothetical protein
VHNYCGSLKCLYVTGLYLLNLSLIAHALLHVAVNVYCFVGISGIITFDTNSRSAILYKFPGFHDVLF